MPAEGTNFMRIVPEKKPEVCLKEHQCCEVFDPFCLACREMKILKARQAHRKRLRKLMVDPLIQDEVIDLVSDAEDDEKAPEDDDDDDDDIAHDPEIRAMWERGEHTCEMFDAPCAVCLKDNEEEYDGEVRVMTEEEVQNDPALTAQPCS